VAIDTTWTDPSTGGAIDLNAGDPLPEAVWDKVLSDLKRLGGTDGDTKVGDMKYGANKVYINDDANAFLTVGLTLNQGAADDEILSLKSSDVAHGMTTLTETDSYGLLEKAVGASGGLRIDGYTGATISIALIGNHTTDNTTKSTAGLGSIGLRAFKKSGTTVDVCGADANLVAIGNGNTTRFLFDAEGSGHADVEWVTYDIHDDLALVAGIEAELLAGEDNAQTARRHSLEDAGIIGRDSWHYEDGRPRAMVNFTRLAMLHHGALLQVGEKLDRLLERYQAIESKLALLEV